MKCQWDEFRDSLSEKPIHWHLRHEEPDEGVIGVVTDGKEWKFCEWHARFLEGHPDFGRKPV